MIHNTPLTRALLAIWLLIFASISIAQTPADNGEPEARTSLVQERLVELQTALAERLSTQSQLQKQLINQTDPAEAEELKARLESLNKEISSLRQTFEHLAIDGADLSSFEEKPKAFNWQEELILITQPLLDMLKSLTEKPRKIEQLKGVIEENQAKQAIIENALASLASNLETDLPENVRSALEDVQARWQRRLSDTESQIQLARIQLATLQGQGQSWLDTISKSGQQFFKGRGLTLAIALVASVVVWLLTRLVLWLVKLSQNGNHGQKRQKVYYRVAAYGFTLLTTLLIISTVIIVFYLRGDILLLALSLVVLAAIMLSMKSFLPQYIAEAKLMLNVGAVREGERTIYNGLPWEVASINIYSILRNPELDGNVRLPLPALREMTSRPCVGEAWFPSSKGDFILLPDGSFAEVIRQTPETVYLSTKGGMQHHLPASDYLGMGILNLSRGSSFIVTTVFGIDYSHQAIALEEVPQAFHSALYDNLRREGLDEHLNDVVVDLKAAGASSLDYLILINVNSSAAPLYFKLERLLQQTCLRVCHQQGWGIPFPQITVHQAATEASGSETAPIPART